MIISASVEHENLRSNGGLRLVDFHRQCKQMPTNYLKIWSMYSDEILPKSCSYSTPVNKSLKIQLNKEFGDTNNFLMNTFLFKKIKIKKIPKLFIRTWLSCNKFFFFLMLVTNCKLTANSKGIPITGLCVNLINLKL